MANGSAMLQQQINKFHNSNCTFILFVVIVVVVVAVIVGGSDGDGIFALRANADISYASSVYLIDTGAEPLHWQRAQRKRKRKFQMD